MKTKILVTGANGQLGKTLRNLFYINKDALQFIFTTKEELDITNQNKVEEYFNKNKFDYCINCAAYTNVDQAELDSKLAFKVNAEGVKYLVESCKDTNAILIQISTDYIFDGTKNKPYTEEDLTNPINEYGKSKLLGEYYIQEQLEKYFIIRTSWLYSEYGNNFIKSMLRLSKGKDELNIVNDQNGSPTYTRDLAIVILKIIKFKNYNYGIYNYSNKGEASWYDLAKAMFEYLQKDIKLIPIKTDTYPTPAKRPKFSVLDKTRIKQILGIEIPHWKDSLKKAILNL